MHYAVSLTIRAMADIEETVQWMEKNLSPSQAQKWYDGLKIALQALQTNPDQYPLAPEWATGDSIVRQKLYGRRKSVYRILFSIEDSEVLVLAVRHASRDSFHA